MLDAPTRSGRRYQQQIAVHGREADRPRREPTPSEEADGRQEEAYEELEKQLAEFDARSPRRCRRRWRVTDVGPVAAADAPARAAATGASRSEEVQPGFPAFLGEPTPDIAAAGRRRTHRPPRAPWPAG